MKKSKKIIIYVCVVLFLFLFIFVYFSLKLRPALEEIASSKVNSMITTSINSCVLKLLEEENVQYCDLISFQKDNNGKISALLTNIVAVNKLKTKLSLLILEEVNTLYKTVIHIPIGNVLGTDLLSGRGPDFEITLLPVGSVATDISNAFISTGINQTRHQIVLDVRVSITVILPTGNIYKDIQSSVCIAETVIVGEIPLIYSDTESKQNY